MLTRAIAAGNVESLASRHDEAEGELRQAIEDGIDWAWRGLAVLLQDKPGREEDARAARQRAIELKVWDLA